MPYASQKLAACTFKEKPKLFSGGVLVSAPLWFVVAKMCFFKSQYLWMEGIHLSSVSLGKGVVFKPPAGCHGAVHPASVLGILCVPR